MIEIVTGPRGGDSRAAARARELLVSFLDDDQREQFEAVGSFDVTGPSGTVFTVGHATLSRNVSTREPLGGIPFRGGHAYANTYSVLLDWGDSVIGPNRDAHYYDTMLAQLLALSTDDRGFCEKSC